MSRLPSQLSDEELLALLDSDDVVETTTEIFEYSDDIVPFLSKYNITPGPTPVSKKLLYNLYKTYSSQPMNTIEFNTRVGNFVTPTRQFFYLNTDNFAISKHIYEAETRIDKTKSLTFQRHFDWFLAEANVSRGTKWIEGFILFFIYKDFCKARRVKPKFGYVNFHKFLKLNFQYRRLKENRSLFFKVSDEVYNIFPEEEKEKIRKAREKPKEINNL